MCAGCAGADPGHGLALAQREWHELVKVQLHANAIRAIKRAAGILFLEMNDSVPEAALMARGRKAHTGSHPGGM